MFPIKATRVVAATAFCIAALLAGCASGPWMAGGPHRTDELFARIQPGMTTEEVRSLAGPPDETMPFSRSRTFAWDYQYLDTWGYLAVFSVTFDQDGRAVSKISRRINDGNDHASLLGPGFILR